MTTTSTRSVQTTGPRHGTSSSSTSSSSCSKCDPSPWRISCETQTRLVDCLKTVLCKFLTCVEEDLCQPKAVLGPPNEIGGINATTDNNAITTGRGRVDLLGCLETALCEALHCLPQAICPPAPPPPQGDTLECNFAVEVKQ